MENFRRLLVWQRSHKLAVNVNRWSRTFPAYERLAFAMQVRDSSSSVPFNIAEACGRKVAMRSNRDPLRQLAIASGSLHELDSQLEYARDVDYLAPDIAAQYLQEVEEIRRMLGSFISQLRRGDRRKDS